MEFKTLSLARNLLKFKLLLTKELWLEAKIRSHTREETKSKEETNPCKGGAKAL